MKVEINVDGEKIPLNGFLTRIYRNVIIGIVKELKGVEENWEELEIKIEK